MSEIYKIKIRDSPNIGAYCVVVDRFCIVPPISNKRFIKYIHKVLHLQPVVTTIAGTMAVGLMAVGNGNGLVVPKLIHEWEIQKLRDEGIEINVLDSRFTALGNLVAVNDRGGIASPYLSRKDLKKLSEYLGIEIEALRIAGYHTVGTVLYATNKGGIIHPSVTEEERSKAMELMKVRLEGCTINGGSGLVKIGIIANEEGILVGSDTTGPELMLIKEAFDSQI
ncbi:hypothetical protein B6U74_00500 [Candidatus Bathyarchaeota archaeon ex4484_205]|nr:MAG: hypothetical protein B6U74_00500 [Candidatus Bathyarchaeota archaeon ex4484_205]RLG68922.1 MAG: translation initiation factor IF-6 [archaeon]HDN17648.1 translation initiation factor IF-6 [Candidatus Bathyarchaeota archaeon]